MVSIVKSGNYDWQSTVVNWADLNSYPSLENNIELISDVALVKNHFMAGKREIFCASINLISGFLIKSPEEFKILKTSIKHFDISRLLCLPEFIFDEPHLHQRQPLYAFCALIPLKHFSSLALFTISNEYVLHIMWCNVGIFQTLLEFLNYRHLADELLSWLPVHLGISALKVLCW